MSSLSSKAFHLKPLPDSAASSKRRGGSAFLPGGFQEFFDWLQKIQGGESPRLLDIELLSFMGDHGVAKALKSPTYRSEKYVLEALKQDSSLGFGNTSVEFHHHWVDLGLEYKFESDISYWLNHSNKLVNSKVKQGTESFGSYPAMTDTEMSTAFYNGRKLIDRAAYLERDLIVFHSGGKGQVLSLYILSWALKIKDAQFWKKQFPDILKPEIREELEKFAKKHPISHDPFTNLCFYGGLETVAMAGAMIRCAEKGIPFLASDPMSLVAWKYSLKMAPGMEQYGCGIGSFTKYLGEDFLTIPELMIHSPEAKEWPPFLAKCIEALRYFNQ